MTGLLHDGRLCDDNSGSTGPTSNSGNVQGLGTTLGTGDVDTKPKRAKTLQNPACAAAAAGCANAASGNVPTAAADGLGETALPARVATRKRVEHVPPHGQLRAFFQQRSKRRLVEHPDGHTEMAGTAQDHPAPSDDAETAPHTEPLHRSVDQSDQAVGDQARGSALSSIDSDQPDRRERELGVPGMGPQCSEPGEKQQEAHQHEPDVTVLPGTSGSVSQPGLGSMLPVPAEQCECNSQSSAAPTESSGRSRVGIAGDAVPQQCMDAAPKRFGQCHPTILGTQTSEGQWEGEAQAEQPESGSTLMPTLSILMHVLSHLCLRNDLNWCYANSTIFCLLWTFMTMQCDFSALGGGICRDDSIFALSQPTTGCTH